MTIINGSLIRTVGLNDRTSAKVQWKYDAWSVASGSIEDAGLQPPAPFWHLKALTPKPNEEPTRGLPLRDASNGASPQSSTTI